MTAQSPDLNLIENLWKILGDYVMSYKTNYNHWTVEETKEEELTKITAETSDVL